MVASDLRRLLANQEKRATTAYVYVPESKKLFVLYNHLYFLKDHLEPEMYHA